MKTLLGLKADYKASTGNDWKSGAHQPTAKSEPSGGGDADELNEKITEQGNKVRQLKADKATKVPLQTTLFAFLLHRLSILAIDLMVCLHCPTPRQLEQNGLYRIVVVL